MRAEIASLTHHSLFLPLDRRSMLALANRCRLFVILSPANFAEYTCLLTGAAEPTQNQVKWFVILDTNTGHEWMNSLNEMNGFSIVIAACALRCGL